MTLRSSLLTVLPLLTLPGLAVAQDRMPPLARDQMTEAQKEAADAFAADRKTPVFGPFAQLLRSPKFMLTANAMGQYLRYNSVLPPRISEFVILVTAREWTQQVEWAIHRPIAEKAGVDPSVIAAIAEGRRPEAMPEDQALAYAFTTELQRNRSVSDDTYARVKDRFGEQGAVDLAGIYGYYTLLAMNMNMARTALPDGVAPPLADLPR